MINLIKIPRNVLLQDVCATIFNKLNGALPFLRFGNLLASRTHKTETRWFKKKKKTLLDGINFRYQYFMSFISIKKLSFGASRRDDFFSVGDFCSLISHFDLHLTFKFLNRSNSLGLFFSKQNKKKIFFLKISTT